MASSNGNGYSSGNGRIEKHEKGIDAIYRLMLKKASNLDHNSISEKWPRVCATINKLPSEHLLMVFLLVLHHGIKENSDIVDVIIPTLKGKSRQIHLPYSGRVLDSGKGVIYKMSSLPEDLRKIIYCYIETISE